MSRVRPLIALMLSLFLIVKVYDDTPKKGFSESIHAFRCMLGYMTSPTVFGPQTIEVTALLAHAANLTEDHLTELKSLEQPEKTSDAVARAVEDGFRDEGAMMEHLLFLQVLGMSSQFYPDSVTNAALAISRRHRIGDGKFTQEDYAALTDPWDQVIGLPELVS